uniref:Spermatogenesis and centriole associated 1 n=1 Tax=Molossus molossus TaxID=27622 RepID=A0A7J8BCA9_MOLMO|nr:spermatogenesis and centriole associated 1 [Molossus molossus]
MSLLTNYEGLRHQIERLVRENEELKKLVRLIRENHELKSAIKTQAGALNISGFTSGLGEAATGPSQQQAATAPSEPSTRAALAHLATLCASRLPSGSSDVGSRRSARPNALAPPHQAPPQLSSSAFLQGSRRGRSSTLAPPVWPRPPERLGTLAPPHAELLPGLGPRPYAWSARAQGPPAPRPSGPRVERSSPSVSSVPA